MKLTKEDYYSIVGSLLYYSSGLVWLYLWIQQIMFIYKELNGVWYSYFINLICSIPVICPLTHLIWFSITKGFSLELLIINIATLSGLFLGLYFKNKKNQIKD